MQFMKSLTEFWDKAGSPLTKIPVIGGTELNLHLLHTTVAKLGGYERVCAERRWMEVRRAARATLALTATLALSSPPPHLHQRLPPSASRSLQLEP